MKSMTGYGSAEGRVGSGRVFVEVRSVNHRYCDIQLKIPPRMNPIDPYLRKLIKANVERGKIEIFIKEKKGIGESKNLQLDMPMAKKYHQCLVQLQRELGPTKKDVHLLEVIDARELIKIYDVDIDYSRYWRDIEGIAKKAMLKMDRMRIQEGEFLLRDQRSRLKRVKGIVEHISLQSMRALVSYQDRMRKRWAKGVKFSGISEERIRTELAALADRMDIAEELTRLKSHLIQYQKIIGGRGGVGRQLDFLLQEMNREINTVGAKAGNAKISANVVAAKSELEKLREQVQNIE